MLGQVLEMARGQLSVHLFDLYKNNEVARPWTYKLVESEISDIVGLWLRGKHKENVQTMYHSTRCRALKRLLREVLYLPHFETKESRNV